MSGGASADQRPSRLRLRTGVIRHTYDHEVRTIPSGQRAAVIARWTALGCRGTAIRLPAPEAAGNAPRRTPADPGRPRAVTELLRRSRIRGRQLRGASLASIGLC